MANRCLLHISKLEEFKQWLTLKDIPYRSGRGDFQVLQVMTSHGWKCIFSRIDMKEHFTVQEGLVSLVDLFLQCSEKKTKKVSHCCRCNGEIADLKSAVTTQSVQNEGCSEIWKDGKFFNVDDSIYCGLECLFADITDYISGSKHY